MSNFSRDRHTNWSGGGHPMVLTRHRRLTGPCSWGPACFVVPERHGKLQCLRGYAIFSGWCCMADAGRRRRKCHGLQDTDDCVLCSQSSETVDHLLVACVFSREVWYKVLQVLGLQQLTLNLVDSLCWVVAAGKKASSKSSQKRFRHTCPPCRLDDLEGEECHDI
jgi:hypothetical protein